MTPMRQSPDLNLKLKWDWLLRATSRDDSVGHVPKLSGGGGNVAPKITAPVPPSSTSLDESEGQDNPPADLDADKKNEDDDDDADATECDTELSSTVPEKFAPLKRSLSESESMDESGDENYESDDEGDSDTKHLRKALKAKNTSPHPFQSPAPARSSQVYQLSAPPRLSVSSQEESSESPTPAGRRAPSSGSFHFTPVLWSTRNALTAPRRTFTGGPSARPAQRQGPISPRSTAQRRQSGSQPPSAASSSVGIHHDIGAGNTPFSSPTAGPRQPLADRGDADVASPISPKSNRHATCHPCPKYAGQYHHVCAARSYFPSGQVCQGEGMHAPLPQQPHALPPGRQGARASGSSESSGAYDSNAENKTPGRQALTHGLSTARDDGEIIVLPKNRSPGTPTPSGRRQPRSRPVDPREPLGNITLAAQAAARAIAADRLVHNLQEMREYVDKSVEDSPDWAPWTLEEVSGRMWNILFRTYLLMYDAGTTRRLNISFPSMPDPEDLDPILTPNVLHHIDRAIQSLDIIADVATNGIGNALYSDPDMSGAQLVLAQSICLIREAFYGTRADFTYDEEKRLDTIVLSEPLTSDRMSSDRVETIEDESESGKRVKPLAGDETESETYGETESASGDEPESETGDETESETGYETAFEFDDQAESQPGMVLRIDEEEEDGEEEEEDEEEEEEQGTERGSADNGKAGRYALPAHWTGGTAQEYREWMFADEMRAELEHRGISTSNSDRVAAMAEALQAEDRQGNFGRGYQRSYRQLAGDVKARRRPQGWKYPDDE